MSQCVNNLTQIGLAIHNYEGVNTGLPWGHGYFNWNDWSGTMLLLPYLEQGTLYNAINLASTMSPACPGCSTNNINQTIQIASVNVLNCPSDTDRIVNGYGHDNYCGNAGNCPNCFFREQQGDKPWRL